MEITEQAALATNSQASAAGLAETGSRRAVGTCEGDGAGERQSGEQLMNQMPSHDRSSLALESG
jgi:hypothetical protein